MISTGVDGDTHSAQGIGGNAQEPSTPSTEKAEGAIVGDIESQEQSTERQHHRNHEPPDYKALAIHTAACALIYPFLFGMTRAARGKTLFEARLLVGLGSTIVGIAMGFTLRGFIRRFMESATWTTLIQQSDLKDKSDVRRMTLKDFSDLSSDPLSPLSAVKLFFIRHRIWRRKHRRYSLLYAYIIFVLALVAVVGALSFALGRIMNITTEWTFENSDFDEVPIFGDILDDPNSALTAGNLEGLLHRQDIDQQIRDPVPPGWRFDTPTSTAMKVGNDVVHFTTPYHAQLRENGTAYGAAIGSGNLALAHQQTDDTAEDDSAEDKLLQFSQWGVRTTCEKLPNLEENIIRSVDSAQVRLPRDFVSSLYDSLGLVLPEETLQTIQPNYGPSGSMNRFFFPTSEPGNSTTPDVLITVTFRWDAMSNLTFPAPLAEVGRHIAGYITNTGGSGDGWTVFDVFLMRCYTSSPPGTCSSFPLVAPYASGAPPVGYDAIACVQRTEPWVTEVRNSTRAVTISRVLEKGGSLDSVAAGSLRQKSTLDDAFGRNLSSQTKGGQYYTMHAYATYVSLKRAGNMGLLTEVDNSWFDDNTSGISAPLFQTYRGVTTATSTLPFLAGNKQIVSRQFRSKQVASAHILDIPMAIVIVLLFLAGVIGCFCVPTLPNGHPRRQFDVYSMMVALKADGLDVEGDSGSNWKKGMELRDVETEFGSKAVVYPTQPRTT